MEHPWSEAARIRATQEAIAFIRAHRDAFAKLPRAHTVKSVERYQREIAPFVTETGVLGFTVGAVSLWLNDGRFYLKIMRGVEFTRRLVQSLRAMLSALGDDIAGGELGPIVDELRSLLAQPALARIPDGGGSDWFWAVLHDDQAFRGEERAAFDRLLELVHEIDALRAMSDVTAANGFVLPKIGAGPVRLVAEGLFHPLVPDAVANPIALDQEHRLLFLTGPNMAGKTTYLRAAATALYLAHLGMGVPAARFAFVPIEQLVTSISLSDDLNQGVSYFRAEALRVKAVADGIARGDRVVAIMDEPFKGTNVKDALDASLAVIRRFATKPDCLFMVSSHLIEIGDELGDRLPIAYRYFEAEERGDRLGFDYVVRSGVSSQRLGMRVLEEEGIFELLDGSVASKAREA